MSESDASRWGWGAQCGPLSTGGRWSLEELHLHINCLELLAGSSAICCLSPQKTDCCILLRMDNISAVRYVNKLGGTKSRMLAEIAKDFWHFCLQNRISVVAEYLPGQNNEIADWHSRHLQDFSDWMLLPQVFQSLTHLWGPCQIDLFASHLSRQVPQFFSWRPDPEALATDAFLQEWPTTLCYAFPPFMMIRRVSGTNQGLSSRTHPDHPALEGTGMVSGPSRNDLCSSHPSSSDREPVAGPSSESSSISADGSAPSRSLAGFRDRWKVPGLSRKADRFISEAWSANTHKRYASSWKRWCDWCSHREVDPPKAHVSLVVNFLASIASSGLAYRTVNNFRSAISAGHIPMDGKPIGEHPLVCKLLRGVRMVKPPCPKYSQLWDVSIVLKFLEAWPSNKYLSQKQPSAKLTMLLFLVSFKRVSDVCALDLEGRRFSPEGVTFTLSRRTKCNTSSVTYPAFPNNPKLCVVQCVKDYEVSTAEFRTDMQGQLLIALQKPFRPVTPATLSRWMHWLKAKQALIFQNLGRIQPAGLWPLKPIHQASVRPIS